MKFQVNDRVRWGTAEGTVLKRDSKEPGILVDFRGRSFWFHADGSLFDNLPGQPLLELVERPKRKVKVWRWESKPFYHANDGWTVRQTTSWREVGPAPDWKKLVASEREIEVEDEA